MANVNDARKRVDKALWNAGQRGGPLSIDVWLIAAALSPKSYMDRDERNRIIGIVNSDQELKSAYLDWDSKNRARNIELFEEEDEDDNEEEDEEEERNPSNQYVIIGIALVTLIGLRLISRE